MSQQLPEAVSLLERNGNSNPADDVDLITIDIGGNDLRFAELLKVCVPNPEDPACVDAIHTALTQVAMNYTIMLSELRAAAGPDTTIAVMAYYNPLPAPPCPFKDFAGFADLVLEGAGPEAPGLNDIIRSQAAAHDAVVAETGPLIDDEDLVGDCLHPNNSGHDDIADAFDAVIPEVTGPPPLNRSSG